MELFLAVVDAGSISAGAEHVGLSLSAASGRITSLERRLGLGLLERTRRGVVATVAGARLAAHARELVLCARNVELDLAAIARGVPRELRLAVNSAALDALPEFLAAALIQMPDLKVDLAEMTSAEAVGAVRRGQVDIAVVSTSGPEVGGCEARPLWADPLVVVGVPGRTEAAKGRTPGTHAGMTLEQVLGEPMVGLAADAPLQRLVDDHARRAGLCPTYRARLPSLGAVCALASTGVGRAIVPRAAANRHHVSALGQKDLREDWAVRRAQVVTRSFDQLDQTATRFVDLLIRDRVGAA